MSNNRLAIPPPRASSVRGTTGDAPRMASVAYRGMTFCSEYLNAARFFFTAADLESGGCNSNGDFDSRQNIGNQIYLLVRQFGKHGQRDELIRECFTDREFLTVREMCV